jgi:hypothetical protein
MSGSDTTRQRAPLMWSLEAAARQLLAALARTALLLPRRLDNTSIRYSLGIVAVIVLVARGNFIRWVEYYYGKQN